VLVLGVLAPAAVTASGPRLPGAAGYAACAAAGPYWPTQTLALGFGAAWIACKEEGRLVRLVPPRRGRSIRLGGGEVIAVVAGLGAIWTLDGGGTVTRIDPSTQRVGPRFALGAARPYNLWVGAESLWSVDDATGEVLRIDVSRRKVYSQDSGWRRPLGHRLRGYERVDREPP